MPTRSSDIGTSQGESGKQEVTMTSKRAVTEPTPEAVEPEAVETVEEIVVDAEDGPDAVGEATAQSVEADAFGELIETGRERIDAIDDQILELVTRRMEIAATLLTAKHVRGITPRDKIRQEVIFTRLIGLVEEFSPEGVTLYKHQVRELYELLIRLGVESWRKSVVDGRRG